MHSTKNRNELIQGTVELAKQFSNENIQLQVISGILTSTDKFIDLEYTKKVRSG